MAKENIVENTLFQIKNLEESLKKNAQGILSSTMKKEINSLVKESLMEQEEVAEPIPDAEAPMGDEEMMDAEPQMGDEEMMDAEPQMGDEEMMDTGDMEEPMPDDETVDMTGASDEEVIRVFKAMGDNDGVVVTKDNNIITLTDDDNEYIIKLNESMEDFEELSMSNELNEFGKSEYDMYDFHHQNDDEEEDDDMEYSFDDEEEEDDDMEYSFDDEEEDDMSFDDEEEDDMSFDDEEDDDMEYSFDDEEDDDDDDMSFEEKGNRKSYPEWYEFSEKGTLYELELDDKDMNMYETPMYEQGKEDILEFGENMYEEDGVDLVEFGENMYEEDTDYVEVMESKSFSPKGRVGRVKKVDFKSNTVGGFNEKRKEAFGGKVKAHGTGKAKFTYKDGENLDGEFKIKPKSKKVETKEASRFVKSVDRKVKRGLMAAPGQLKEEVVELRTKNQEYRKALDLFRTKLNEVAVFNSNLAYATRLFTEHSTTKQEKINILRRFDDVETLKESKNLYRVIKNELSDGTLNESVSLNESIQRTVNNSVSSGSAVNLIESKTYENPQFLRMKDLMTKIK